MIGQGHASIDEFEGRLRTLGLADVRLLVHRAADEHSLITAVVNAGRELEAVADETYDYGEIVFVTAVRDGNDVADWLTRGSGEAGGRTFTVPEPTASCSWERSESRSHADYGTLFTTPHTDYRVLAPTRAQTSLPATVLAGAGLPFFPDVNVAAASVLFGVHSMPGGRTIPSEGTNRVHAEHPWVIDVPPGIRVSGGAHSLIILDSFTPSRGFVTRPRRLRRVLRLWRFRCARPRCGSRMPPHLRRASSAAMRRSEARWPRANATRRCSTSGLVALGMRGWRRSRGRSSSRP